MSKLETQKRPLAGLFFLLEFSKFEFVSDFGFRISDFCFDPEN